MSFDLDLLDDILLQPSNASERTLGKFQPKARRKNEVIQQHISSDHTIQNNGSVSVEHVPKELPLSEGCMDVAESSFCVTSADTNTGDYLQRDQRSSVGQNEVALRGSDSLDDILPKSATITGREIGKFQPKMRVNASKLLPPPSCCTSSGLDPAPCARKPSKAQEFTSNSHPEDPVSNGDKELQTDSGRPKEKEARALTNLEPLEDSLFQASETSEAPMLGATAFVNVVDGDLQTDQRPSQGEAADMLASLDLHDDLLIHSEAVERPVGKFQPKLKGGMLTKAVKATMSTISDATNSYDTLHTNSAPEDAISEPLMDKDSAARTEGSQTGVEAMSAPFDIESVDKILSQPDMTTDVADSEIIETGHSLDLQADHERLQREEELDLPEDILLQPASSAARGVGKFQPKFGSKMKKAKASASVCHDAMKPAGSLDAHSAGPAFPLPSESSMSPDHPSNDMIGDNAKASAPEAAFPDNHRKLDNTLGVLERDRINSRKRKSLRQEAFGEDVEEHSQGILEGGCSTAKDSEVTDAGRASRQTRKSSVCAHVNEPDDGSEENCELSFDKSSDSQMVDERSDDEYTGRRSSKKRAPRKSQRLQDEKEKSTERHEKVSLGPDSSAQEPQKKRFSHSTRRGKRQVDEALLKMLEEDIDPMKLPMNQLIMLGETREQIASKEAATARQSIGDQSFGYDNQAEDPNDEGDEVDRTARFSSTKLNYHTYMTWTRYKRWSKVDTELFYQGVRQFGTDFAMIQQLFPDRTRHQIKQKFKNEERKHPLQIADALFHRSKDHSHFELVIQRLQTQEEENSNGDAADDTMSESQPGTAENELQEEDHVKVDKKEEQEEDDWDQGYDSVNPNENHDVFDWSQYEIDNYSSHYSMEKDEHNIF